MKKFIFTVSILLIFSNVCKAQQITPVSDFVNSRIYSTNDTNPLNMLERTNFNDKAIMQLQKSNTENIQNSQDEQTPIKIEEKGLKNLFKGFHVIW